MENQSIEFYSKLRPLNDRVVVQRVKPDDKSKSGLIHLPGNAQEKKEEGVILAVGPGRLMENGSRREPLVKKGDKIVFEKYAGGDKEFIVIYEADILGVFED